MTKNTQASQGSASKILLAVVAATFIVAALVLSIIAVRNDGKKDDASKNTSNNQQITVEGMFVCLPHKDKDGPQTLECAFGIKTDKDKYYGLEFKDPSDFPMGGERMRVTGALKETNDIYDSEGNIVVESYKEL